MNSNHNDLALSEQVKAILKKDLKRHHTQADLAKHFHISETKLRKIFKRVNNTTIHRFVTDERIESAKLQLETTDDPVKLIAFNVGLAVTRLEKQFKKLTGMLPLEWRKNSWDNRA